MMGGIIGGMLGVVGIIKRKKKMIIGKFFITISSWII
jgi:hypothetical protein